MGDLAQSPLAGINYFNAVVARLGQEMVEQSARLYVSPASKHGRPAATVIDASAVPTMVDLLDPLDRWADGGRVPDDALVQTVKATVPPLAVQAARPMCRYPDHPRYTAGDRLATGSYVCTTSQP